MSISPLLLRSFEDVLTDSFRGKQYQARIESNKACPVDSLRLWRSRGFEPSDTGTAFVKFKVFRGIEKEYTFPAYFWSE